MSLAHFVTEAKKNTPVLGQNPVSKANRPVLKTESLEQTEPIKADLQRTDLKRTMSVISDGEKFRASERPLEPAWKTCQYLKNAGSRQLCKQYMSWCAMEKCQKKFMETDFFDFKKGLKQHKTIK